MNKDTVICMLSDMHSGGSTALFPHYKQLKNGYWQFKHTRYTPSGDQVRMAEHFDKCAEALKLQRKDKRLIIVHDGDAIDGNHHNSLQVASHNPDEQIDIHVHLMKHFTGKAGFAKNKGDKLYYVTGTEVHVGDKEDRAAQELGAEPSHDGKDAHDFLPLEVNGRLLWFLHHGAAPGNSWGTGDSLRLNLKRLYWSAMAEKKRPPDAVISGHLHKPTYSTYNSPQWTTTHGIILPSWQTKTRFGYRVAPSEINRIGMQTMEIKADGKIHVPPPMLLEIEDRTVTA